MNTLGNYEILKQLSSYRSPLQRFLARDNSTTPARQLHINQLNIRGFSIPAIEQIVDQLNAIKALAEISPSFIPIEEIHQTSEEIWWVEPLLDLPCIIHKMDLEWSEKSLHAFIADLAEALDWYYVRTGAAHGNLSSSNILVRRAEKSNRKSSGDKNATHLIPVLTGFSFAESATSNAAYVSDLHAIGKMIIGIVHRENVDGEELHFPLRPHPNWDALGPKGNFWKQLASWLVYPDLTIDQLNIPKLKADLRPRKKYPILTAACWAIATLALAWFVPLSIEQYYFGATSGKNHSAASSNSAVSSNESGQVTPVVIAPVPSHPEMAGNSVPQLPQYGSDTAEYVALTQQDMDAHPLNDIDTQTESPLETNAAISANQGQPVTLSETVPVIPPGLASTADLVSEIVLIQVDEVDELPLESVSMDLPDTEMAHLHVSDPILAAAEETEIIPQEELTPPLSIESEVQMTQVSSESSGQNTPEMIDTALPVIAPVPPVSDPADTASASPHFIDLAAKQLPEDGDRWKSETGLELVFISQLPRPMIPANARHFSTGLANNLGGIGVGSGVGLASHEFRSLAMQEANSARRLLMNAPAIRTTSTAQSGGFLSNTEISQGVFEFIMGDNPSIGVHKDSPVNSVSWQEATEFCHRLTMVERTHHLPENWEFILPTTDQIHFLTGIHDQSGEALLQNPDNGLDKLDTMSLTKKQSAPLPVSHGTPFSQYKIQGLFGNIQEWAFDEQAKKAVTLGWSYDFTGNARKSPFTRVPMRDRGDKRVGLRVALIQNP